MGDLSGTDLAVVIPTRDRWDILGLTLDALSRQTVSGFETIVVVDGDDQDVPSLDGASVVVKRRAGPAAARNAGARSTPRSIVMFLGDDTIPAPDLIERHVATHRRHPEREAAVVGHVAWHDSVAGNRINDWLDWSGTQFWFSSLAAEGEQEVSHWYFYTSNVSVKRELLLECGGFDEDFPFAAFEDIECALRLSQLGLRLFYEPAATCKHLHDYDWPGLERRFASMALSERLMVEMHPEIAPGCLNRMTEATGRPALPADRLVDTVATRFGPLDRLVRHQANRHYHRRLAPGYIDAWDRAEELCELRRYLGERYDSARLVYGSGPLHDGVTDEDEGRLFDLARQALVGATSHAETALRKHLPRDAKVLQYLCGIGSEGLHLASRGYSVEFADQPGPPLGYLRWRLARRGLSLPVHELGPDEPSPEFDAAFCLDASGPGRDPVTILDRLGRLARLVVLRLEPGSADLTQEHTVRSSGTATGRLAARQVLPDGSCLHVYRRPGTGPLPPDQKGAST